MTTTSTEIPTFVSHLECGYSGETLEPDVIHGLSPNGKPILVRYDLDALSSSVTKEDLAQRPEDLRQKRLVGPGDLSYSPLTAR